AGTQSLTAGDIVTPTIKGSAAVSVQAASASHFAVSAPTSALTGSAIGFTVTALDAFNNTATGYAGTVRFSSGAPLAFLPSNSTLSAGLGVFSATLLTAGGQPLTVTDTANSSITGTATIAASYDPNPIINCNNNDNIITAFKDAGGNIEV